MKTSFTIISLIVVLITTVLFNAGISATPLSDETSSFKVYGNCTMCKSRIEKALQKNKNIKKATWNVDTKILTVVYDPTLITLNNIHKMVAEAGHDTDKVKASDKVYQGLPSCCHYRK